MERIIKILSFFFLIPLIGCLETDRLEPDPCAEVDCSNQFICIDGNCVCPNGYKVTDGQCLAFNNYDYVLSRIEGDTNCFNDLYVFTRKGGTSGKPFPDFIRFHVYSRNPPEENIFEFKNDSIADDDYPIRGTTSRVYDYYFPEIGTPCEKEMEPTGYYIQVNWDLYYTDEKIELTATYHDKLSGKSLGDSTHFTFQRFDR